MTPTYGYQPFYSKEKVVISSKRDTRTPLQVEGAQGCPNVDAGKQLQGSKALPDPPLFIIVIDISDGTASSAAFAFTSAAGCPTGTSCREPTAYRTGHAAV